MLPVQVMFKNLEKARHGNDGHHDRLILGRWAADVERHGVVLKTESGERPRSLARTRKTPANRVTPLVDLIFRIIFFPVLGVIDTCTYKYSVKSIAAEAQNACHLELTHFRQHLIKNCCLALKKLGKFSN